MEMASLYTKFYLYLVEISLASDWLLNFFVFIMLFYYIEKIRIFLILPLLIL